MLENAIKHDKDGTVMARSLDMRSTYDVVLATKRVLRFGFIVRDDGGKDIFVHTSVLQRAGIESLSPGQRVTVDIVEGRKGPEASSIRLA